jgi:4-aminobutyrate aminotransferase-like enzyme
MSMATALTTLDILERENLLERSIQMGDRFSDGLNQLKKKYELIGDVRGKGLMIGIELVRDAATKEPAIKETGKFIQMGKERGVLFGRSTFSEMSNVIKIKPPLVISEEQVDRVLAVFEEITMKLDPT